MERGGGGRFSALFMKWLINKGHEAVFRLDKGRLDAIYDVAVITPISVLERHYRRGTPVIYRMDGMGGHQEDRPIYIEKCEKATCVVYQSKFCQRCAECFTDRVQKSTVIYNGVVPNPNISSRPQKTTKILVYCRPQDAWNRQLGGQEWLEVLERHQEEFGYEIVRVNSSTSMKRSKLFSLMRQCDIFIHTAYYEACSNTLLEAMSCGCAVIVTDDSGNAEIVGQEGCLVKTYPATRNIDYSQFTHKDCDFLPAIEMDQSDTYLQLKRCLDNLQHFKQYSLDRIKKHFTIEKQAQAYFDLIVNLTKQS